VPNVKKNLLILMLVLALLAAGLSYAPSYLAYSTDLAKADAVIILLGPVFNDREQHARDLIKRKMADNLIIPAYNKTYVLDRGTLQPLAASRDKNKVNLHKTPDTPSYYEDTHLELLAAKKTMAMQGQKSAIFVSSPYHMRRIQMMVKKEFNPDFPYYFSPTPYETVPLNVLKLKASDWKKVWREYVKILWFLIYSSWTK
jgi:hypothetical protein